MDAINNTVIKKSRIQWKITDHRTQYNDSDGWIRRPLDVIDTIIVSSTGNHAWQAGNQYYLDTSKDNDVTPGKPLPGIGCHLFVNNTGLIELTSDYENVIYHTPGSNYRSLNVLIQYAVENNNAEPTSKILSALTRLLTILCLQFKLDPYKAIKGQSETFRKSFNPLLWFMKGRPVDQIISSPGPLVDMSHIRQRTATEIQKKLLYAGLYSGTVRGIIDKRTKRGINLFYSEALQKLYTRGIITL